MPPATRPLTEDEILSRLIYRDAIMLVLNKPAGIAVHVTGHDKVALDRSFHHLQFGLPRKPELAHRLDRDTSGCLVLGRHRQALIKLGKLFEQGKVEKTYLAIVVGTPPEAAGIIDAPILKSGTGSNWRLSIDPAGQHAVTHYTLLKTNGALSLLELSPKTGRTHQLRLHCEHIGCPIVGDPFYGAKDSEWSAKHQPLMLHAVKVAIPLKATKDPITIEAPMPEGMAAMCAELGA